MKKALVPKEHWCERLLTAGAMIVALRKQDGAFDTTPSPDAVFEAGDVAIGVGTIEEIRKLEELFAPRAG